MLELRDLSFAYPAGRPLLEGLSFTFRSGGICAVLGPNGTGKTTLLKLLLGILKPSSGEMLLSGMPIGRMTAQRRARKLAYIPQDVSLRFPLSVFEFVLLGRKSVVCVGAFPFRCGVDGDGSFPAGSGCARGASSCQPFRRATPEGCVGPRSCSGDGLGCFLMSPPAAWISVIRWKC